MSDLASAKDDVKAAATCDMCGIPKKPGGHDEPVGSCGKCWLEMMGLVDDHKEATRRAAEKCDTDEYFDFCKFLDGTATALFTATPALKPEVLVDKAVAMWEEKEEEKEKSGYKAVVEEMKEEMTKRTTVWLELLKI